MEVKVKVPSHDSLMFFKSRWQGQPFFGEYEPPMSMCNDLNRLLSTDTKMISHMINKIKWETFDPKTSTVIIDVDFVGPYGSMATSDWLKGDIRFAVRTILVKNQRRIITWDLIHRPIDIGASTPTREKTQQEVDIEGAREEKIHDITKEIIESDDGSGGLDED